MKLGIVADNVDPLKQGRILVTIPGIYDEPIWAEACMPGSPFSNGIWVVPAIGAQVVMTFLDGDRDLPIYFGAVPPPVAAGGLRDELSPEDLARTITVENDTWVAMLGPKNTDYPILDIRSRPDGAGRITRIVMDQSTGVIEISCAQGVQIKADGTVRIDGTLASINGRPIALNRNPI